MGQITSGNIGYERTLNLGDYNSKKARADIAFTAEGDYQAMADLAGTVAIAKVHELLALAEPAKSSKAAAPAAAPAAAAGPSKADLAKAAEAAAGKTTAEPAKPKETKATVKKPPAAPVPVVDDPAAMGGEAADDLSDLTGEAPPAAPAKEITDQDIVAAITRKNQALKDGGCTTGAQMIRTLIGEFIAPPGQARQIEQGKRGDFMKKLDALKPAT